MTLCPNSTKTKVIITFGDGSTRRIEFNSGNIEFTKKDILMPDNSSPIKCWRFGETTNSFEWFGCGQVPEWRDDGAVPVNSPAWIGSTRKLQPYLDGVRLCETNDWVGNSYVSSPSIVTSLPIQKGATNTYGSCDSCSSGTKYHEYTFKDANNNIFKIKGLADSRLISSCDDGCPEGQMKCECDDYPGYKCIPCSGLINRFRGIESQLDKLVK